MSIEIKNPELEALIQQELESGLFRNIDDLLTKAIRAFKDIKRPKSPKRLIDVLRDPRFAGSGLEIERQKDLVRDIDL